MRKDKIQEEGLWVSRAFQGFPPTRLDCAPHQGDDRGALQHGILLQCIIALQCTKRLCDAT